MKKTKSEENELEITLENLTKRKLIERYKKEFPSETDIIKLLGQVNLMTPENIHLNSFMYEPILDMGLDELKQLYSEILKLNQAEEK